MKYTSKLFTSVVLLGLTAGIGIDLLLRQPVFGLNIVIIVWAWTALCLAVAARFKRISRSTVRYSTLALISSGLIYVRSAEVVQLWLLVIAGVSLWLLAASVSILNFPQIALTHRVSAYMAHLVTSVQQGLMKSALLFDPKAKVRTRKVPVGAIIAVILACIFLLLFTSADRVMAGWLSDVGQRLDWFFSFMDGDMASRIITSVFWTVVSVAIIAALLKKTTAPSRMISTIKAHLTTNDARIILVTLVSLFAVFVAVQCRYLFGSASLPDGLTYASYAHQGYGQLLFATFLAALVIKYVLSATKGNKVNTMLALSLIFLNAIVVLAAWMRLSLYEMTYGWTMLRFIARLGLICIGLGMSGLTLWVMGKLNSKQLYASGWYIIAGVLLMAAVLNPEGIIAKHNITERPSRTVVLDVPYLDSLSADSWPAICESAGSLKGKYPVEYAMLRDANQDQRLYANHGLARHYAQTHRFQTTYNLCLRP